MHLLIIEIIKFDQFGFLKCNTHLLSLNQQQIIKHFKIVAVQQQCDYLKTHFMATSTNETQIPTMFLDTNTNHKEN